MPIYGQILNSLRITEGEVEEVQEEKFSYLLNNFTIFLANRWHHQTATTYNLNFLSNRVKWNFNLFIGPLIFLQLLI